MCALIPMICIVLWRLLNVSHEWLPESFAGKEIKLPISVTERSQGVIAKIELNKTEFKDVLEWYRKRGYSIVADSSGANGYGPQGISFELYTTNQAAVLVLSEWKDMQ
jgi:hypothetical protein